MKKLILFASLVLSINAFGQIPTNGLVGYWPFNGNANDASGNNYNGTVKGATLTADRFGNANSAFQFSSNSSNEYILINSIGALSTNIVTISFWYNAPIQTTIYSTLYSWTNVCWANLGGGGIYDKNQLISIPGNSNYFELIPPIENTWHHVVVNTDFTSQLTTRWLDGKKDVTYKGTGWSAGININNPGNLLFGIGNTNANTQYTGKLDDIYIFNRALTQLEVNALFNENLCYQTITVTDTLIINVNFTGFNPVTYANTIKIFPNPSKDKVTIDCGNNYSTMNGYTIKITNSLSQTVYTSLVNQQSTTIDLSSWTGRGIYFVHVIDTHSNTIDIKKIVLQ